MVEHLAATPVEGLTDAGHDPEVVVEGDAGGRLGIEQQHAQAVLNEDVVADHGVVGALVPDDSQGCVVDDRVVGDQHVPHAALSGEVPAPEHDPVVAIHDDVVADDDVLEDRCLNVVVFLVGQLDAGELVCRLAGVEHQIAVHHHVAGAVEVDVHAVVIVNDVVQVLQVPGIGVQCDSLGAAVVHPTAFDDRPVRLLTRNASVHVGPEHVAAVRMVECH